MGYTHLVYVKLIICVAKMFVIISRPCLLRLRVANLHDNSKFNTATIVNKVYLEYNFPQEKTTNCARGHACARLLVFQNFTWPIYSKLRKKSYD